MTKIYKIDESLSKDNLLKNKKLLDSLSSDMSIELDLFILCITPEIKDEEVKNKKEEILNLLENSTNICFNKETNKVQLRQQFPKNNIKTKKSNKIESKENLISLLLKFNKSINSIKFNNEDKTSVIRLVNEESCSEIQKYLEENNIESTLEKEDVKDYIMNIKGVLLNHNSLNSRKISDENKQSYHKNSIYSSSNKKKENQDNKIIHNKFDSKESKLRAASIYQLSATNKLQYNKNIPNEVTYSNNDIESLFKKMLKDKKFVYPEKWNGLDNLSDFISKEYKHLLEKDSLDYVNPKEFNRVRANTEINPQNRKLNVIIILFS